MFDVRVAIAVMQPEQLDGVVKRVFGRVTVCQSSATTGDFGLLSENVHARRSGLAQGRPTLFPQQVHGATVLVDPATTPVRRSQPDCLPRAERIVVGSAPDVVTGRSPANADGVVTGSSALAISVITADCVPVAFWTDDGVIGVAHAGWRGLLAGVVESTAAEVAARSSAPESLHAAIGPCIGRCCYEFGADDLALVAGHYGEGVLSTTTTGSTSLDMLRGVGEALHRSDATLAGFITPSSGPECTACGASWFSWRRDRDPRRQTMTLWLEPDGTER